MLLLSFKDDFFEILNELLLKFDALLYRIVGGLYRLFGDIASTRFLSNDMINQFVKRLYLVVSIIMLFILAYSFLMNIINPDSKKEGYSPTNFVKNLIIAVIVFAITTPGFRLLYKFQYSVVNEHVIEKIILGNNSGSSYDFNSIVVSLFESTYYLRDDLSIDCSKVDRFAEGFESLELQDVQQDYCNAHNNSLYNGDVSYFKNTASYVHSGEIEYHQIISTAIAIYVIYCLIIFIIDISTRAIKLVFLQIVSPLPIFLSIVPGKSKTLTSWAKNLMLTFVQLFIKILIITFGVFVIEYITYNISNVVVVADSSGFYRFLIYTCLILGVFTFMRKAPKLIEELLGIKLDENGFSLKKRIEEIKEGAKPVSRVAGAFNGARYANKARKMGEKVRGEKDGIFRRGVSNVGGFIYGFNSGWKNSGKAFNYEMTNQEWYSSKEYENMGTLARIKGGIDNRLRNNVGAPTLFEEKEKEISLRLFHEVDTEIDPLLNLYKSAAQETISSVNREYDPVIKRNSEMQNALKNVVDRNEELVKKANCKVATSSYINDAGNEIKLQSLDYSDITDSEGKIIGHEWKTKDLEGSYNWNEIERLKTLASDNQNISENLRKKLVDQYSLAQKQLMKEHYRRTNLSEKDSNYIFDIELENRKKRCEDVLNNYKIINAGGNGKEFEINSSNLNIKSLDHLKDTIDDIKSFDAEGKKIRKLNETYVTYSINNKTVDLKDINGNKMTVFDVQQAIKDLEDQKKDLSDRAAAEKVALGKPRPTGSPFQHDDGHKK